MVEIIVPILLMIVRGLIWGFITQVIIDNKGRSENWFWWGFFFGIIASWLLNIQFEPTILSQNSLPVCLCLIAFLIAMFACL